jgi:predicted XRE-type DNA-binding protein
MDRAKEMQVAAALNKAIWLREAVDKLDRDELLTHIVDIARYEIFSSRQLSAIVDGKIHHSTISKLINKTDRTGGNLNVGTLYILRNVLYSRANHSTDYGLIAEAVGMGTSQGMVSKLTGINQGTISKKIRGLAHENR